MPNRLLVSLLGIFYIIVFLTILNVINNHLKTK